MTDTSEAGHYQDADGRHWLHQIHNGSAYGAPDRDTDQWLNPHGKIAEPPAELTRLYTLAEVANLGTQHDLEGWIATSAVQAAELQELRGDRTDELHDAWEAGWSALFNQHSKQTIDPKHPITRENPYR